ncbi:hypothetical protein ABFV99_13965 [Cytobacillus horneckiae]|uniref:hypothetical protein n=1 Tax=Cytobacillus horneckiae TaxID=549687 RepID=UPI0034CEEAE8
MKQCLSNHVIERHRIAHTLGPWKIGKHSTTVVSEHQVETTNKRHDGGVNDQKYYGGSLIGESILRKENAALIAAAPDMYEVLLALAFLESDTDYDEVIERAQEIVKNIRGV